MDKLVKIVMDRKIENEKQYINVRNVRNKLRDEFMHTPGHEGTLMLTKIKAIDKLLSEYESNNPEARDRY